jgi:hypothetical protein
MSAHRLAQELCGGLLVTLLGAQTVHRLAVCGNGAVQLVPGPLHFDIRLI